jgi:phosphatidylserine synthase
LPPVVVVEVGFLRHLFVVIVVALIVLMVSPVPVWSVLPSVLLMVSRMSMVPKRSMVLVVAVLVPVVVLPVAGPPLWASPL